MTGSDRDRYAASLGQLLAEIERLRSSATRLLIDSMADSRRPERGDVSPGRDVSPEVEELADLLRSARAAMLKDPVGARALVAFLAAEGRRYAETPTGAMWRDALLASPYLDHLRDLWESVSLDIFDHVDEEDLVPTAWVDMLSDVLNSRPDIEALLAALRPHGFR